MVSSRAIANKVATQRYPISGTPVPGVLEWRFHRQGIFKKGCKYFIPRNVELQFRMLTIMLLQIYILGFEPYKLAALNETHDYKNDLFNKEEISSLLEVSHRILKDDSRMRIVISDLCPGNYQYGDLLICDDNGTVYGAEVKSGEKNYIILRMVLNGEENPFSEETDRNHYKRVKKQWERGERITEHLNSAFYFGDWKGRTIVVSPYWIDGIETFREEFKTILKKAGENLYSEARIDAYISVIAINNAAYQASLRMLAPPCFQQIFHRIKRNCLFDEAEMQLVKSFYQRLETERDRTIYYYNNYLYEAGSPQPYIWGASSDLMLELYNSGINIFICVDIEGLFDYIRKQGFKVYAVKEKPAGPLLDYKGKRWKYEYKAFGEYSAGLMTYDTIKRITQGLYTSKDLVKSLKIHCEMFYNDYLANRGKETACNDE